MKKNFIKNILFKAFGHTSASIASFGFFYALFYLFAINFVLGGFALIATIITALLLINSSNFVGEYDELLDA